METRTINKNISDKISFIIQHNSENKTDGNKFVNWTETFICDALDCDKRYQILKNYEKNKITVTFEEYFDKANIPFNEKLFYHECHQNDILWNVKIIIE